MFISVPKETINVKTLNYLHFEVLIFLDHNLTNKLLLIPKLQFDFEAINFHIYTKICCCCFARCCEGRKSGWLFSGIGIGNMRVRERESRVRVRQLRAQNVDILWYHIHNLLPNSLEEQKELYSSIFPFEKPQKFLFSLLSPRIYVTVPLKIEYKYYKKNTHTHTHEKNGRKNVCFWMHRASQRSVNIIGWLIIMCMLCWEI